MTHFVVRFWARALDKKTRKISKVQTICIFTLFFDLAKDVLVHLCIITFRKQGTLQAWVDQSRLVLMRRIEEGLLQCDGRYAAHTGRLKCGGRRVTGPRAGWTLLEHVLLLLLGRRLPRHALSHHHGIVRLMGGDLRLALHLRLLMDHLILGVTGRVLLGSVHALMGVGVRAVGAGPGPSLLHRVHCGLGGWLAAGWSLLKHVNSLHLLLLHLDLHHLMLVLLHVLVAVARWHHRWRWILARHQARSGASDHGDFARGYFADFLRRQHAGLFHTARHPRSHHLLLLLRRERGCLALVGGAHRMNLSNGVGGHPSWLCHALFFLTTAL